MSLEEARAILRRNIDERDNELGLLRTEVRDAEPASLRASLEAVNSTTDKLLKNTIDRESLQHTVIGESPNMVFDYSNGVTQSRQEGINKFPQQITVGSHLFVVLQLGFGATVRPSVPLIDTDRCEAKD